MSELHGNTTIRRRGGTTRLLLSSRRGMWLRQWPCGLLRWSAEPDMWMLMLQLAVFCPIFLYAPSAFGDFSGQVVGVLNEDTLYVLHNR